MKIDDYFSHSLGYCITRKRHPDALNYQHRLKTFTEKPGIVFVPVRASKTEMGSTVRLSRTVLLGVLVYMAGLASARSPRTADQVSEADIQRLLHGAMEQLGIARHRIEYPAHQATNIVGPQSIQGGGVHNLS
ncbi:unnamed protein product [Oncorhynchus mykiss]|uniref:Neuroendocrine protein 7B2 n=1 Tax=Oncorhynchus mykiss TaxID=8022 RepID=A0A060YR68_ONCMY|nr:unnamed protein product [Oncorhynchus mykiss]